MCLILGIQASVSEVSAGCYVIFKVERCCKTSEVSRKEWTKFILIAREAETCSQLRNMGQSVDVVIAMGRYFILRNKHSLKFRMELPPLKKFINMFKWGGIDYAPSAKTETVAWNSGDLESSLPLSLTSYMALVKSLKMP